jgi:hypothetical protein
MAMCQYLTPHTKDRDFNNNNMHYENCVWETAYSMYLVSSGPTQHQLQFEFSLKIE